MTRIPQANSVIAQHWRASLSILTFGLWQVSGHAQTQPAALPAANNVSAAAAGYEPPVNSRAATLTGTLFNTREQRERLDRARQRGGVIEDNVETMVEAKPSVINGFVKRSDGRDTVWVDDVMKRDPRAEVIEQLEPNMVGGVAGGAIRVAASKPIASNTAIVQTYKKAVAKKRTQKVRRKLVKRL